VLHAHPGPSRALLLDIAARTGAPLFFTVHGGWVDSIHRYIADLRHVFCVSESLRRHVLALSPKYSERVSVAPNGVDLAHFPCVQASPSRTIVIASRFDYDKRNVVDLVKHLWEEQARQQAFDVQWTVAGQGTLIGELEEAAASLHARAGTDLVTFDGWIAVPDLARRYRDASAVIAAGRGAMEAMAMGRPGVAAGSGGVCPLFDMQGLVAAAECNFGGMGSTPLAEIDIPKLWDNLHRAADGDFTEFGIAGSAYVREHLDATAINARMLERYREALATVPERSGTAS
jgi:glycosyltransferase involved in cell wall biosynthesis